MPIEIRWLKPNHILISQWHGHVTCQDMVVLIEELQRILQSAPRPIHTLLDMSEAEGYEKGIVELYFDSPVPRHPNRGTLAVVNAPPSLLSMIEDANRIAGYKVIHIFNDYQSAQQFLLSRDSSEDAAPPAPPKQT